MTSASIAPPARFAVGVALVAASAIVLLVVVLSPGAIRAEGNEDLRATLDEVRTRHDLPALWAGRFHADGRRVFAVSGVRKHGEVDPARPEDLVHIGSCTKAMTAVMIARLWTAGKLSPDTTLAECFPEVHGAEGGALATSRWGSVTIDDLLRHTSGAPANPDWWALHRTHPSDPVAARRGLLEWLLSQPRPAEPGFLYSNVGYALLGHIVESSAGKPWEKLVAEEVFQPLGIGTAGFGPLPEEGRAGAWGHVVREGVTEPVRIDNPPPLGPAGRVHLSMEDWSRFALAFTRDRREGDEPRLGVSPRDWARWLAPRDGEHYAGGWGLHERAWGGGRVLSHAGSNTTWTCVAWVAPGRNFCLLGATNSGAPAAAQACDEAVSACLDPRLLPLSDSAERR
ncbi:MAG: serine hydrolase domain-containing protein [Planctomycetia bacterium]